MTKPRWIALYAAVTLLVTAAANARPGNGNGGNRPREAKAEGTISAVSQNPASVTITNGTASITLGVTSATKIEINDQRATLADLTAGMDVEAKYDPRTNIATKIEVEEPQAEPGEAVGVVLSADPASGVVSLDVNNDGVVDVTLNTNAQTEIKIGSLRLTQADLDLVTGLVVKAEFDPTTFLAREIKADATNAINVTGTVTAVDAAAGTLTIQTATGPLTLQVPAGADIRVNGKQVTLSGVLVGDRVQVSYLAGANNTNIALRVAVQGVQPQNVTGNITDVTGNTVTITTRTGQTVTLTVDAQTDLRINGKRVTVAQLDAALDAAVASNRTIKVSAQYVARGGINTATRIHANAQSGRR